MREDALCSERAARYGEFLVLEQLQSTEKEPWLGTLTLCRRYTVTFSAGQTRLRPRPREEVLREESLRRGHVEAAVAENGLVLEYASDTLKRDETVARAALDQNGLALQFADVSFRQNRDLVEAAISNS